MGKGPRFRFAEDVDDCQLPDEMNQSVLWNARLFRDFTDRHAGR